MNSEITPEQKLQLNTWAGQRDALLLEISVLRTSREGLEKTNKELAISNTDIVADINQVLGRIEELKKKEIELVTLQSKELSVLQANKNRLESDIEHFNKEIESLEKSKKVIIEGLESLTSSFVKIEGRTSDLNKIVDHVTRVSADNVHEVETLVSNLKKSLGELININTKNVLETNVVIEKLPQMLIEVKRQNLVRPKII